MKVRELLNRVLRAIGEPQIECSVEALSDENHMMVLEFFNQYKEDVEDAHNWRSMASAFSATVSADATASTVTGANARARLMRIQDQRLGRLVPLVFDVTNPANPIPLQEIDSTLMQYKQVTEVTQHEHPVYFTMRGAQPSTMQILTHPRTSSERTLSVTMFNPQEYFDVDDLDTEVLIPYRALLIGTIWYALQERGEELGQGSMYTEEMYRRALDAEIAIDSGESGEMDLVVV